MSPVRVRVGSAVTAVPILLGELAAALGPRPATRPAVVTWPVDFATLGFAPGTHVLLVALASATSPIAGASDNTLQSAERTVRTLIEGAAANAGNTQAAARLVRLDPVVVIPPP